MNRLACLVLAAAACAEDGNIDKEACEHLQDGPIEVVTASDKIDGAPVLRNDHKRYDLTLVDIGGSQGGFVSYASSAEGDYAFFFNADVPVRFLDAAGAEITTQTPRRSGRCPEVKSRVVVPMRAGTHALSFGPTSQAKVGVVIEEAAHER